MRLGETQLAAVSQLEETNSVNCWIICKWLLSTWCGFPSDISQLLNHRQFVFVNSSTRCVFCKWHFSFVCFVCDICQLHKFMCSFACDICQFVNKDVFSACDVCQLVIKSTSSDHFQTVCLLPVTSQQIE